MISFSQFEEAAHQGNVVPVWESFLADTLTPVSAAMCLRRLSEQVFLLESVEGGEQVARYSFLGYAPFASVRFSDGVVTIDENGQQTSVEASIFDYLKERFAAYRTVKFSGLPRFTGGAVGYFGYETVRCVENVPCHPSGSNAPEAALSLFGKVLAFDHVQRRVYIMHNVFLDEGGASLGQKYENAVASIEKIREALRQGPDEPTRCTERGEVGESNFGQTGFENAVRTAKAHIGAGDVFQVVLSQKFRRRVTCDSFDIYRALRAINPSPYLYYLQDRDLSIVGSSPEMLVRVEGRAVEVRPIAGTRPRGATPAEDALLQTGLLDDAKESAEHVMLVDLGRNDIGRVCDYGSVEVTQFRQVEKYSHVMHMVSGVSGRLRSGKTSLDALQACFPAGTVSGAPKVRAMQLIHELEPERRGVYSGALGYLDFSGNLDTCIAIRTIVVDQDGHASYQAGAGIVADSHPAREYQETLDKSGALREAIDFAERGLK